jgi:glutamate 5-kinase
MGSKTSEVEGILGYKYSDEVIHRDDLAVLKD